MQVTVLAEQVQRRLDRDVDTRSSGLIINTCGWIDGAGFDVLLHCVKAFKADVVLVMHQDKLYANLLSTFDSPAWTADGIKRAVVRLPSSAGVVNRVMTIRNLQIILNVTSTMISLGRNDEETASKKQNQGVLLRPTTEFFTRTARSCQH